MDTLEAVTRMLRLARDTAHRHRAAPACASSTWRHPGLEAGATRDSPSLGLPPCPRVAQLRGCPRPWSAYQRRARSLTQLAGDAEREEDTRRTRGDSEKEEDKGVEEGTKRSRRAVNMCTCGRTHASTMSTSFGRI